MAGIKIIDVKIVGSCSEHQTSEEEVIRNKHGELVADKDIFCVGCMWNE